MRLFRVGTGQNIDFAQIKSSFEHIQGSRIKPVLGEIADKGNQLLLKFDSSRSPMPAERAQQCGVRHRW
jgi:hypothetical protein